MLIQKKIQAGFAVALAFLLLTGVSAWWSARRNEETFQAVTRTYEVLDELEATLVEMLNTETGSRGFAISGDEKFLAPYQTAIPTVRKSFDAAKRLTQGDPGQQRRLAALEPLIEQKIRQTEEGIALRRSGDTADALRLITSGQGQRTMDEIRRLIGEMENEEEQMLQPLTAKAQALSRTTMAIVAFGGLLSLGLVSFAGVTVRRDFEKRRQAEEALRRSEESLEVTLDSIGDAVMATDTGGRITRLNPVAEILTGWTQTDALGRPVAEVFCIINEETREPAIIPVDDVLATGKIHGLGNHTVLIARDGTERPIADSAAPIRDQRGCVTGVVLCFRDQTAERQAEQALRESEERHRLLISGSRDAIMTLNPPTWRFTSCNPATLGLFGVNDEAQFCALGPWELSPELQPDGRASEEKAAAMIATAMRDGSHFFKWTHRRLDGWPFSTTVLLSRIEQAGQSFLQATVRDITAQKAAEEASRNLNTQLEALVALRTTEMRQALLTLDATEDAAFIFDTETLRFTRVNAGAVRQLGYTREELLGMTPGDIDPEFHAARFRERIAPMLRGEVRSHRFTTVHRHRDGHAVPVEINVQYVAPEGGQPRFVAISRDISERLQHERLALRSQRLESIGTLAGGVAHDLNNALAPIVMGMELLRAQYPGESKIVEMFEASAKRSTDMVRQLLAFARGAGGERVSLHPERLVGELEKMMKGSFPKNIEVNVKSDPSLPSVLGDVTQLHQVLLNLCVNARDAMPSGGTLTLDAYARDVDASYAGSVPDATPGKYVMLRVRDTGTGIPPKILDRIFDPFFTTKGPDKGTGLGLSTVMGIVKGHGGFLQVDSQPGEGSTFSVCLPAEVAGTGAEPSASAAAEFRGQGEAVLFVDDEAVVREMAHAVLQRLNFKPLTATDGADGLTQATQHRAELHAIFTDLHMPRMDGLAFVRELRKILPDIPVVVASGRLDDAVIAAFATLGVTVRLDKPFTELQLADTLKSIMAPR